MNMPYEEVVRSQSRRVILAGDPEPDWLRQGVMREEALQMMRADRSAARVAARFPRRIVSRLRMALAEV